tara:strand:- start:363 stop:590 length:228 start_codon:yes stop_codon:yes gene_type:complete
VAVQASASCRSPCGRTGVQKQLIHGTRGAAGGTEAALDVSQFNFKGSTWQTETKNIYKIKSMNSCKKKAKNETTL